MIELIEIAPGVRVPAGALVVSFSRSGGPGGQNVNKLSTKAELRLDVAALEGALNPGAMARFRTAARNRITRDGFLQITSQQHRTQEANRADAMEKLAGLVIAARIEPKIRRPTRPSKGSKRRRLEGKKHRSEIKQGRSGAYD